MKKTFEISSAVFFLVAVLWLIVGRNYQHEAFAAKTYNAANVIANVQISTGIPPAGVQQSPYSIVIDARDADSVSWQQNFTCASGQLKLQQSNDNVSYVDVNQSGSSITIATPGLTPSATVQFSITWPAYAYYRFVITNSSAPAGGSASNCTANVTQSLKSVSLTQN